MTATRCPSDLALEAHLLDPARSAVAGHLEGCPGCRERLARMEREGAEFRQYVYPATVDAVAQAAGPRPRRRWLVAVGPLVAAAGAGLVFLLWPGPSPDYVGIKGGALGLSVFVGGAEGARAVADGEGVPASAALRFQVRPEAPCRLWIVSVDASGQVSRIFPAEGEGGAAVSAPGPLPGGAMLDGRAGPERIYAVCGREALPYARVEAAVRQAAGGGERAVRAAAQLRNLPEGSRQATLLLEKRP